MLITKTLLVISYNILASSLFQKSCGFTQGIASSESLNKIKTKNLGNSEELCSLAAEAYFTRNWFLGPGGHANLLLQGCPCQAFFSDPKISHPNFWTTPNQMAQSSCRNKLLRISEFYQGCLKLDDFRGCNNLRLPPESFLPLLLLFLYFLVSRFMRSSRLCQLLALCLKCRRPGAWTGFQTFFEYQHSNLCKRNDRPSLYERCLRITNLLRMSTFEFK